jgi:hypothetical protein
LLVLAVFLLVFFVALGASRSLAHVGGPGDLAQARRFTGSLIIVLVGVAVVPATVYAAWELLRQFRGEEWPGGEAPSPWKRVAKQLLGLASAAVIIVALALAVRENRDNPATQPTSPSKAPRGPTGERTATERTAEALLPWVLASVSIALVLLIAVALVLRRRRLSQDLADGLGESELEQQRRDLHEVIGDSLAEIEREPDPRKAVIRAYAGMERVLARHGLGRRRFEAPVEYLTRALAAVRLSGHAAERLTRLFERARFSEHTIGPEMKSEAIAALGEVRSELEPSPR